MKYSLVIAALFATTASAIQLQAESTTGVLQSITATAQKEGDAKKNKKPKTKKKSPPPKKSKDAKEEVSACECLGEDKIPDNKKLIENGNDNKVMTPKYGSSCDSAWDQKLDFCAPGGENYGDEVMCPTYNWCYVQSADCPDSQEDTSYGDLLFWRECPAEPVVANKTLEVDPENSAEEDKWGQIKLIGNNDGRTVGINTTEKNITSTISTHITIGGKAKKRPQGNKRNGK